ncbi:P-loop containing nucleoside triphosphate hydrolase protein [Blyttiomyces helicus]|uniref:P-loop containing nucleoside triphosphate hydrolase protein n=1 Tax=Blyttiomyces helicus TaxID=388810 RepID=A0A4P9W8N0_9FUNG|nr:P-loop containing nucleoside triphosphate hydrolase protein [Blyttiomyces helicus]|eukprot:RKO87815.1 P-loop containing nucleoside triphosphate hydrolase protein [Blyttiomyces helicus]
MNLSENEFLCSLKTLKSAADKLQADATLLHERSTATLQTSAPAEDAIYSTSTLDIAAPATTTTATSAATSASSASPYRYGHVLVRRRPGPVESLLELRICVVGNVDAGKSTLLGVLTKDVLDDGRGKARVNLFRHKHEIESGRTSSVGMEIMGFNSTGEIVTPGMVGKVKLQWDDICQQASKVLTFMDLAGHEKYLKTTVFGMTGCAPDFVMLMIGSNAGIIGMTKEHLGLTLALQVPVFIVVTKIDMCPKNVLETTIKQLIKILKSSGCRKIPMFIKTVGDVLVTAGNFVSERVCPIFQVSNVSGEGLDLLRLFLNVVHANGSGKYDVKQPVEYSITDTFSVPGVGTVVSGTITSGIVHVGDSLLLGPDSTGHFTPTIVKSIQRKRVSVPCASAGHSASFALKKVKRAAIRKGMVMLSKTLEPKAVYEFEAEILVLYHSTTIGAKYQAMLHCGCVRQTAKIIGMDQQVLRTGDRALVQFRFLQHPEYLKVGTRLLFREGRTKGVGKVVRLITEAERLAQSTALHDTAVTTGKVKPPNNPPAVGQGGKSTRKPNKDVPVLSKAAGPHQPHLVGKA